MAKQSNFEWDSDKDELNQEKGLTIILITHEPEVADHAQRQLFLRDGRLEPRT